MHKRLILLLLLGLIYTYNGRKVKDHGIPAGPKVQRCARKRTSGSSASYIPTIPRRRRCTRSRIVAHIFISGVIALERGRERVRNCTATAMPAAEFLASLLCEKTGTDLNLYYLLFSGLRVYIPRRASRERERAAASGRQEISIHPSRCGAAAYRLGAKLIVSRNPSYMYSVVEGAR